MDKSDFVNYIKRLREVLAQNKKNFTQAIDMIITLKKIPPIEGVLYLPHPVYTNKIAGFVDDDYKDSKIFDFTIHKSQFNNYDKKAIKKLGKSYDIFFGESTIMPLIAAKFGKILTSYGKMPSPKYNTVFTPTSNVAEVVNKMKNAIIINSKKNNAVSIKIGDEKMSDEDLADNAMAFYSFVASLANTTNIKRIYIKGTMTPPIKI